MQFVALKECPQGQHPGDVFEATEDAGNVLVLLGAAKVYAAESQTETKPKRQYVRRDLKAEA